MNRFAYLAVLPLLFFASAAYASCDNVPNYDTLKKALVEARAEKNGGLNLDMWGVTVDRSGKVCAVAYTGTDEGAQWPLSRIIAAQKANTANGLSLPKLALSTANLYSATQPGGSLFGLQESNPVDTQVAYDGDEDDFGTNDDPLVGKRIGGVNVFGGGLALYNSKGEIVGGLGVSGDTSCADHNIAWRTRSAMKVDFVPAGVSPAKDDNIIYDVKDGKSTGGYGHVTCGGTENAVAGKLTSVEKVAAPSDKK